MTNAELAQGTAHNILAQIDNSIDVNGNSVSCDMPFSVIKSNVKHALFFVDNCLSQLEKAEKFDEARALLRSVLTYEANELPILQDKIKAFLRGTH